MAKLTKKVEAVVVKFIFMNAVTGPITRAEDIMLAKEELDEEVQKGKAVAKEKKDVRSSHPTKDEKVEGEEKAKKKGSSDPAVAK